MLSEEMLKQAASELAHALNESLPKPEQYQHKFSAKFEEKMQFLFSSVHCDIQKDEVTKNSQKICNVF